MSIRVATRKRRGIFSIPTDEDSLLPAARPRLKTMPVKKEEKPQHFSKSKNPTSNYDDTINMQERMRKKAKKSSRSRSRSKSSNQKKFSRAKKAAD